MAAATNYTAQAYINWRTGQASMPATGNRYMALFTTAPTDAGGGTEASGNGYARINVPSSYYAAAAGTSPSSAANTTIIAFAASAAGAGYAPSGTPIVAWGTFDALTGGNLIDWDYLGPYSYAPFSCTAASPGVLTSPAHGFSNGDQVVVTAEFGGTLPATGASWSGLLTVAGVTTDTFNLGVNTTGSGSGCVKKVVTQVVAGNTQMTFPVGASSVSMA